MNIYQLQDAQITLPQTDDLRKVYVELSSECNFACEMCFRHSFADPFGSMSAPLLARVQAEIAALPRVQEVVLGGLGEPLLHPQLIEMLAFLQQRRLPVTITTNGALLAPLIDSLVAHDVDRLVLSFETGDIGHANENYMFDLIKKVANARTRRQKSRPRLAMLMVVTQTNIQTLTRVAHLLQASPVEEIILSNLLPANPAQGGLVLYPKPEPPEIKAFKNTLFHNDLLLPKTRCLAPEFTLKTERACDFIDQHAAVIRWDGEVAPCYRFLHARQEIILDHVKDVQACSFGNLQDENLLPIWNKREYAWFRFTVQNSRYPSCLDCSLRAGCELLESTRADCWGNEPSCADCLWARRMVKCP